MSRALLGAILMAGAYNAHTGGSYSQYEQEGSLDDRERKAAGKMNGHQQMREFVINGVSVKATDLKMAKKKYNLLKVK